MSDEGQQEPSARDRRRERAKGNATTAAAGNTWKRYRVHLAIILLFGAIVAVMSVKAGQEYPCPGHWHSSMAVWVDGEEVSFAHPKFTLEGSRQNGGSMPISTHMHRNSEGMWHFEPPSVDCQPLGDALRHIDMEMSPGHLVLKGAHAEMGQADDLTDDGNRTLRAYHRVGDGEWSDISIGNLVDRQLRPDERVIVVFGNDTDEQVDGYKTTAEERPVAPSSRVRGSFVPVVGVSIMGLVILAGWNAISKKM